MASIPSGYVDCFNVYHGFKHFPLQMSTFRAEWINSVWPLSPRVSGIKSLLKIERCLYAAVADGQRPGCPARRVTIKKQYSY